jgi:hypothetical protein
MSVADSLSNDRLSGLKNGGIDGRRASPDGVRRLSAKRKGLRA